MFALYVDPVGYVPYTLFALGTETSEFGTGIQLQHAVTHTVCSTLIN